jgi:membrane dipeptidase
VVHINFFESFLDSGFAARYDALKTEQEAQSKINSGMPKFGDRSRGAGEIRKINAQRIAKLGRIPLSRLLDHFDHAIKVAGIDHVGPGSDFDGVFPGRSVPLC